MVVGTDSVHMKEYSHVNENLAEKANCQNSDQTAIYSGMVHDSCKINNITSTDDATRQC